MYTWLNYIVNANLENLLEYVRI